MLTLILLNRIGLFFESIRRRLLPRGLETIESASIEQLLMMSNSHPYPWHLFETRAILEKCTTPNQVAYLYVCAVVGNPGMDYINAPVIDDKHLETIRTVFLEKFEKFLREFSLNDIDQARQLHRMLDSSHDDEAEFPGDMLLQKRLEVVWRRMVMERFNAIKYGDAPSVGDYSELFHMCKPGDPLQLEIAQEVNVLAMKKAAAM